jgi:hypothetical protein
MKQLTSLLVFSAVALLIASFVNTGLSTWAGAIFALVTILEWRALNRVARIVVGAFLLALLLSLAMGTWAETDLRSAVFLYGFITVTGTLRANAARDPVMIGLGRTILQAPPARRYLTISLGTGALALALLMGALQLVAGLVSAQTTMTQEARIGAMRATLAGFTLNPILSPIAIPAVVIGSAFPGIDWLVLLPGLSMVACVIWLSGTIAPHESTARPPADVPPVREFPWPVVGLLALPLCLSLALAKGLGIPIPQAAVLVVVVSSVAWPLIRKWPLEQSITDYLTSLNEASIVAGSVATGLLLMPLIPREFAGGVAVHLLSLGPFLPAAIIVGFIAAGMVGLQPAICFMLLLVLLGPAGSVEALPWPVHVALISGWALNSVVSPFGVPVLIAAKGAGLNAFAFAWSANRWFTFGAPLASAVILSGLMVVSA